MGWLILIVAGLFEVVWAVALKMSNGFKNITADAVFVGGMAASVWLLAVAMKSIPMGTAYAVWTGVGAVGGFVAGIALFGESASASRSAVRPFSVGLTSDSRPADSDSTSSP